MYMKNVIWIIQMFYRKKPRWYEVADFFDRQGVSVVNMAGLLSGFSPKDITVNALDGHANEMVNQLLAEHLYKNFFRPSDYQK